MTFQTIKVTGGNGFVGSHTVLRLLEEGFIVTVVSGCINASYVFESYILTFFFLPLFFFISVFLD